MTIIIANKRIIMTDNLSITDGVAHLTCKLCVSERSELYAVTGNAFDGTTILESYYNDRVIKHETLANDTFVLLQQNGILGQLVCALDQVPLFVPLTDEFTFYGDGRHIAINEVIGEGADRNVLNHEVTQWLRVDDRIRLKDELRFQSNQHDTCDIYSLRDVLHKQRFENESRAKRHFVMNGVQR